MQPLLDDLISCVQAPSLMLSPPDGQLRADGVQGVFVSDRRVLNTLILTVDGVETEKARGQSLSTGSARFSSAARPAGDGEAGDDWTSPIQVERLRKLLTDGVAETVTLTSTSSTEIRCTLQLTLGTDLADLADVRSGSPPSACEARADTSGLSWGNDDAVRVCALASPNPDVVHPNCGRVSWALTLAPGASITRSVIIRIKGDPTPAVVAAVAPEVHIWSNPSIVSNDGRLATLVGRSLDDLRGLLLADPLAPADYFIGAGSPWYLTLFGRDSLWAARMLLPLGTELAAGTLNTLARRQGLRHDPSSGEEPGKIPHELRRTATSHTDGHAQQTLELPSCYYGTVDATALWIILLHDAWRWGMPAEQVAPLIRALEAALVWMRDWGTGPSGFISYLDHSGHGLVNQGWKDSHDGVRFADGRLAAAPVSLCEVQAYSYQAAINGAALLQAFDRPGGDEWLHWAADLQRRFRERFWVDSPGGAFPAIALDRAGKQADSLTSNIGHILGTGLLTEEEASLVARRLFSADMDSGYGLRTLSSSSGGYNPLSYHCGSVWPHDTAITFAGLAAEGHAAAASNLIAGLLGCAPTFDYRLPELFSGDQSGPGQLPRPYPAACRPQAWAAASAVAMVSTLIGLRPDVPTGRLQIRPLSPSPVGSIDVCNLRLAGTPFDVQVDNAGVTRVRGLPANLSVLD